MQGMIRDNKLCGHFAVYFSDIDAKFDVFFFLNY